MTTLTKTMNTFNISFENEQKQEYCSFTINAVTDKAEPDIIRLNIRCSCLDEAMVRQFFQSRSQIDPKQVPFRIDPSRKELTLQFVYKDRLFF